MGEAKTNRQILRQKADTLTDSQVAEVLDYINIMESLAMQAVRPDLFDDELINLLAEASENRRARVVNEWEGVRRRAERRAAMMFTARKSM